MAVYRIVKTLLGTKRKWFWLAEATFSGWIVSELYTRPLEAPTRSGVNTVSFIRPNFHPKSSYQTISKKIIFFYENKKEK